MASPAADPTEALTALARAVYAGPTYHDVYARLTTAAVEVVPGCDHASIMTLVAGEALVLAGANDDVGAQVDSFEQQAGEGPCLDAIIDQRLQRDPDLTTDTSWPKLSRLVLAHTPVRGIIGYRILVGDRKAGALNLFSDTPGALTETSEEVGAVVAAFASVALAGASQSERADQLQRALQSNREIGKAVGLLMGTQGLDDVAAFEILRQRSSHANVKLAEIARRLVEEHGRIE